MRTEAIQRITDAMDENGTRVRVAFADDEPHLRRGMARLLTQLGYEVVCNAEDGATLLEYCRGGEVDVALVDLDMPVMDGLATAQELSAQGIPVILISGHPDAEHVVVEAEPVVSCIFKPASADVLDAAIRAAVDQHAGRRGRPK
jgi:DNA-binding response OmpR family regulator